MNQFLNVFLPLLIIIGLAGLYTAFLYSRQKRRAHADPKDTKTATLRRMPKSAPVIPYMEPVQIGFQQALMEALPKQYIVYVNVPVEKLFDNSSREALNMKGQYADFVVFTPDLLPVLVIDLFDMSLVHLERVNKIKNISKNILRNSGVPVLDYRAADVYNIDALRRSIADLLNPLRKTVIDKR